MHHFTKFYHPLAFCMPLADGRAWFLPPYNSTILDKNPATKAELCYPQNLPQGTLEAMLLNRVTHSEMVHQNHFEE